MTAQDEVVLIVEEDDVEHVRTVAAEHGVELVELPSEGFEPITTVTLIILGGAAAVATVAHLVEQRKGGQVFDLRPGAPKPVYRSRDVVYGLVVVYRADGTITVDVKEPKGMFGQVLEAVTGLLGTLGGESLKAAQDSIAAAVGDAATVTAAPH
ncbi:MAG: hypothetical protein HOY78_06480 [Saccharothrix sp.]|nr:hypothetical protein [Saccharothrix sp.]